MIILAIVDVVLVAVIVIVVVIVRSDLGSQPKVPGSVDMATRDVARAAAEHADEEHADEVMLAPTDLPHLTRQFKGRAGALHEQAREWIDYFAAEGAPQDRPFDLASAWKGWKGYVATHKNAEDIVGPGVTGSPRSSSRVRLIPTEGAMCAWTSSSTSSVEATFASTLCSRRQPTQTKRR